MKNTIEKIPKKKREELLKLTQQLSGFRKVEMVILFGSYARGNWVEDTYIENDTIYEYRSDYDLLVVLRNEDHQLKFRIEDRIKAVLTDTGEVGTPVNMIFHGIKHLNRSLTMGNYFFRDIKEEGIMLYNSGNFKLADPRKLSPEEYKEKAQAYFNQWYESANMFFKDFQYNFNESEKGELYLNQAAFLLHQAVERYYTTILLVYTDYRPKVHNLEALETKVMICDNRFDIFPKATDEEKRLFELLKKAYIDARYKMNEYRITQADLNYLATRVTALKKLTKEICLEKIEQMGIPR